MFPSPAPCARLPCVQSLCCDHVGCPGRAACFGFLGLSLRSFCELLSFSGSTSARTSADLRAPSAHTLTSPAGRLPVMPLVRYRKVAILGYRSVGESPPSREHHCFVARRGALWRKCDTRTQCGLGRSRVCYQETEGWRDCWKRSSQGLKCTGLWLLLSSPCCSGSRGGISI